MEQNVPIIISKKVWGMVRVILFMLRKGISKGKLRFHLNMILKRCNKIATKALTNLTFHQHHQTRSTAGTFPAGLPHQEYEFSCSNTPNYNSLPFFLKKLRRNHHNHQTKFFGYGFNAPQTHEDDDDLVTMNAVKLALEMLSNDGAPPEASPWLPGFRKSPMVRQLRITDSPFLMRDDGDGGIVDRKAEEFIKNFYKDLRQQPLEEY